MMAALRSALRALRSRRLAVGLIAGIAVYSVLGTLVPQVSLSRGQSVDAWQAAHPALAPLTRMLGLHDAFNSPLFLLLIAMTAASTTACAWERSTSAWKLFERGGRLSDADVRRLRQHPQLSVPLAEVPESEVLARVESALRRRRLRVRRGPKLLEASGGRIGLLGSPLFHTFLALLFLVTALGRLSRSEGALGVPLDSAVVDQTENYARSNSGPLYPGHSKLRIGATDLVIGYRDAEGVNRGPAPVVALYSGERRLAGHRVYPNSPLRYGSLLIHMAGYGLAPTFALESPSGSLIGTAYALIDFDAVKRDGTTPGLLSVTAEDGSLRYQLTVVVPADRDGSQVVSRIPRDPRVALSFAAKQTELPTVLRPGESMKLPEGARIKFLSLDYYARLTIADDWSIYPIYILFTLAAVAMSVAVVMPYRTVHVLLASGPAGPELHAVIRHRRGDPLFAESVEAALREAAGLPAPEKEESA